MNRKRLSDSNSLLWKINAIVCNDGSNEPGGLRLEEDVVYGPCRYYGEYESYYVIDIKTISLDKK